MTAPTIAFFNNKGGVGKTSLVYHLAWMYADLGFRVLAADLDPQANLTAAFLDEDRLEALWDRTANGTIYSAVSPLVRGTGDVTDPNLETPEGLSGSLALVPGDLQLSRFEDELAKSWPACLDGQERDFRVVSSLWRILQRGADSHEAQVILMDLGPNLGALNRAALISADFAVIPLGPDLFSLQGLKNLGPTVRRWRDEWQVRRQQNPAGDDLTLPTGELRPVGYIVLQHSMRLDRPVKAYEKWIARIPTVYRAEVLDAPDGQVTVSTDENCIALLKHYRSLMPMAQEAGKPMFHLKPADGAIGGHLDSVHAAYRDFKEIALEIARRTGLPVPAPA